jgi:hypothetical protein
MTTFTAARLKAVGFSGKQAAERCGIEPAMLCYAGKQEHNCYIFGRDPGSVCGQGYPQGVVLLLPLWILVMDNLIWELNYNGYYMVQLQWYDMLMI